MGRIGNRKGDYFLFYPAKTINGFKMMNSSPKKINNNIKRFNSLFKTMCFLSMLISTLISITPIKAKAKKPYKPVLGDPVTELWRWHSYPELNDIGIRYVVEDDNGIVWLNVKDGLAKYDDLNWVFYNAENTILIYKEQFDLTPIYITNNNIPYIGDLKGVCRFYKNKWERIFPPTRKDLNYPVHWISETSDGSIWAGTSIGALQIKDGNFILYTSKGIKERIQDTLPFVTIRNLPELPVQNFESFYNIRLFEAGERL